MESEMKRTLKAGALALLLGCAMGAGADERSNYYERRAADDIRLFVSLDRDTDGKVTLLEAQSDINFLPRFAAMEVDMDGAVTRAELLRYIDQRYAIRPPESQAGNSVAGTPRSALSSNVPK
jgi:hypothetical protein